MFSAAKIASPTSSGYNLTRSLRFRASASAYLNKNFTIGTNPYKWTWSGWVKRGQLSSSNVYAFMAGYIDGNNYGSIGFSADQLYMSRIVAGAVTTIRVTNAVFRDPSAWYHVVFVFDSQNATLANRANIYVNGVLQTYATTGDPNPVGMFIGYTNNFIGTKGDSTCFFDGYMAEVNFIDGQALTPSSFGSYNSTTGVWQPAKYTGTYGTNGFYLPFTTVGGSTYAASFNGSSQSLSGTLASAIGSGNFTVEMWVNPNAVSNYNDWFGVTRGAGGFNVGTDAAGTLVFYSSSARQLNVAGVISASRYTHVAFVRNGTTLTGYVNGVSVGTATVSTNFSATGFFIGSLDNTQEFNNGLISNLRVTNTAVYTANFTPPSTALTAISGTMLLTLQSATIVDNSGNSISISNTGSVATSVAYPFVVDLGSDFSGNNNNWATNNISLTPGVTYDSMTDVPTLTSATAANFAVINPLAGSTNLTNANGNLQITSSATGGWNKTGTIAIPSGKWYWESVVNGGSGSDAGFGIYDNPNDGSGAPTGMYLYLAASGNKYSNATSAAYGATWTVGDVIGIAFDSSVGSITYYKNGVSQGVAFTGITGTYFPVFRITNTMVCNVNFGQQPFSYTPPTGFVALNTYNLPTSTVLQGSAQMNAVLQLGSSVTTGATLFSQLPYTYGMVWGKDRTSANNNQLVDTVRGTSNVIQSNTTAAETTYSAPTSTDSCVAWGWNAGSAAVTNTNGTITSTVSVNASAGFSVVTYTGTAVAATVGHGLGVAPSWIVVKGRTNVSDWRVYHSAVTLPNVLNLNTTSAAASDPAAFGSTAPTSSVFTLGTGNGTNASANTYVAYCWAAIAGFSAFGSYTGNGSTDGPFIYTGFRPRYIFVKRTDAGGSWHTIDTSRSPYNQVGVALYLDLSAAENADFNSDILSNGLKIRNSQSEINASGGTYVYAAFAENPTKYALAR